ncbi:MAG: hypothetical protein ABI224_07340, partial [Acetobacteraceae bacterium]
MRARSAAPAVPKDCPPKWATNTPGAATWRQPRSRAQAKVVFLPVALGEQVGAQQSSRAQAVAANIQAKADADRDVDDHS